MATPRLLVWIALWVLAPATAQAGPDFGLPPPFALTRGQWNNHTLGEEERVLAEIEHSGGSPQVVYEVEFLSRNGPVFAKRRGVLPLHPPGGACTELEFFAPFPMSTSSSAWGPLDGQRDIYDSAWTGRKRVGRPTFVEWLSSHERPIEPAFQSFPCEKLGDLCARGETHRLNQGAGINVGVMRGRLVYDCEALPREMSRCQEHNATMGARHQASVAQAAAVRDERLRCTVGIDVAVTPDGDVVVGAAAADGSVWGAQLVERPWIPVSPAAFAFAPVTFFVDMALISFTTLIRLILLPALFF